MKRFVQRVVFIFIVIGFLFLAISVLLPEGGVSTSLAYPAPVQPQMSQMEQPPYPGLNQTQPTTQPVELLSSSNSPIPITRKYAEEIETPPELQAVLSSFEKEVPVNQPMSTNAVGWSTLFFDDSPLKNHQWPCDTTINRSSSNQNKWGSAYYDATYQDAAWPAAEGTPYVNPFGSYPRSMDTFFVCGRHNLSQYTGLRVVFDALIDLPDDDDYMEVFLTSSDKQRTIHVEYRKADSAQYWRTFTTAFALNDWTPEQKNGAWFAFRFISDSDNLRGNGVWLDNIKARVYRPSTKSCGYFDPGNKGLNTPSRHPLNDAVPAINGEDLSILGRIDWADPGWVRMVFQPMAGETIVDLEAFDFMVDNLCDQDISVLAVINNETIPGRAYDPENIAYREHFAQEAAMLAEHFAGRVTYWEVWNEQNLGSLGEPPYVQPLYYAPLLQRTYRAIKDANPGAQVAYGGLAQAFEGSFSYFDATQERFDIAGVYPYNLLALHPYTDGRQGSGGCATLDNPTRDCHGIDPQTYMYNTNDPDYDNIFERFLKSMSDHGYGNRKIWTTEIGWNTSLGSGPHEPTCQAHALVYEHDQANYLKPGFDIMLNDVRLWGQSGKAIEKAFWFGLMDFALENKDVGCAGFPDDYPLSMSWGLYRGDWAEKPSWCDFRAYPLDCEDLGIFRIYLPSILRGGVSTQAMQTSNTIPLVTSPQSEGDISISYIFYEGDGNYEPDEYIEIQNNDSESIQLQNWTVKNASGNIFSFPYLVMQPGQACRIYTNESQSQWCGLSYNQDSPVWQNRGDTAALYNEDGNVVDSCAYSRQRGVKGVSCATP